MTLSFSLSLSLYADVRGEEKDDGREIKVDTDRRILLDVERAGQRKTAEGWIDGISTAGRHLAFVILIKLAIERDILPGRATSACRREVKRNAGAP